MKNLTQNSTLIHWKDRLLDIPAVQLGIRTFKEMNNDDGPHLAAGIAYYTVLSLFPLILGLLALASFFISPQTAKEWMMDFFRQNLPTSTDLLEQNLDNIYRFRGVAGLASLVALFWMAVPCLPPSVAPSIGPGTSIKTGLSWCKRPVI